MNEVPQLIILGSIAVDDIETPFGKKDGLIGGSAVYAAYSARLFAPVGLVSIVGDDFSKDNWKLLNRKNIDISGIQVGGKTFHWQGYYEYDMNAARTIATDLNCLESFEPELPEGYRKAKFVFLGNTHPAQQMKFIEQLEAPEIIAVDTMNLWIKNTRDLLVQVIRRANIIVINEAEVRELFNTASIVKAAQELLALGPGYVIIKKGEHGALMFTEKSHFSAPGYPLETVKDPTGCGDCFGGGLMGYIAKAGEVTDAVLRRAIVYGSVCASYNAEDFGLGRILNIKKKDIEARYKEFREIRSF